MSTTVPPQRAGPRLYKNFLSGSLHRRFTKASIFALLFCYVESVIISDKTSFFWSWFPIGLAGIRALLIFIAAFVLFIQRVALLHVGSRNNASALAAIRRTLFSTRILWTFGVYIFSGWFFGEVYFWSAPNSADLGWTAATKSYERPRLNERPIFLRSCFLVVAIGQSCAHLYYDIDRIELPLPKKKTDSSTEVDLAALPALFRIRQRLLRIISQQFAFAICVPVISTVVYFLFLRTELWQWHLFFAKLLVTSQIRPTSAPHSIWPPYFLSLVLRSISSSFLLLALWNVSHEIFGTYVSLQPLKKGQPLTAESRDPNGSLLSGLKTKRDIPKAFALWELLYITYYYPVRRKTIFEEIDRIGGSTWSQIMTAVLDEVASINTRITTFGASSTPVPPPPPQPQQTIQRIPRIAAPLRQENVLNTPAPGTSTVDQLGNLAKAAGQSPSSPVISPALKSAASRMLTQAQRQSLTRQGLEIKVNPYVLGVLHSPVGIPFRQTFDRRVRTAIIGSPTGDIATIVYAADILTKLAICSLTEDPYGRVQSDVPQIITTLTQTIGSIEAFMQNVPIHWTDIDFKEREGSRQTTEVSDLLSRLRAALGDILDAFKPYMDDLNLDAREIRQAKEAVAVGRRQEMTEKQ